MFAAHIQWSDTAASYMLDVQEFFLKCSLGGKLLLWGEKMGKNKQNMLLFGGIFKTKGPEKNTVYVYCDLTKQQLNIAQSALWILLRLALTVFYIQLYTITSSLHQM